MTHTGCQGGGSPLRKQALLGVGGSLRCMLGQVEQCQLNNTHCVVVSLRMVGHGWTMFHRCFWPSDDLRYGS